MEKCTCSHYVPHKKRFCRMLVAKGNIFCGQHLVNEIEDDRNRWRIPCPLDPKHSCFASKLEHHLLRCNAKEKTKPLYFQKNINLDDDVDEPAKVSLKGLVDEKLLNIIFKLDEAHKAHVGLIETKIKFHPLLEDSLSTTVSGPSTRRHLQQNSSLLGILREKSLLENKSPVTFIEFGAGRGELSGWLMKASDHSNGSSFILIDRGAQRYKVDSRLKHSNLYKIKRIRMDIQHLNLNALDELEDCGIVATGKHLCGAATDLSLRCLMNAKKWKLEGVLIALCCHHRCTWASYTGKQFLQDIGFSRDEFSILVRLTSWAVSSERSSHDEHAEKEPTISNEKITSDADKTRYERLNLPVDRREVVGRNAKQLLDLGRVKYLRSLGLTAQLIQYVQRSLTLENVAIFAHP